MIRTNSKKAVENIRRYILEWDEDYIKERAEYEGRKLNTEDEVLAFAYGCFKEEMNGAIERNWGNPCFVIFEDWARGLAMGSLFCYYYNRSARGDLAAILEETEEEEAKYTEQQAEELLTRLIYRELEKADWKCRFGTRHPVLGKGEA